ncbi:MAG: S-formylglutathione hydrolase [Bdellovibrionota bacterium]
MDFEILKKHKSFDGETWFCEHSSNSTKTQMKFSAFVPSDIKDIDSSIIWLSGLTCNEENFITKAGVQKYLAGTNTLIICPDTSPRGLNLDGEDDSYDFGSGASFYVNATKGDYSKNYQMYDYIINDLIQLLKNDLGIDNVSIMGHSMGGHGALVLGIRNPGLFKSISAFSPIVNPINSPWGIKAFKGYLGENVEEWKKYDAYELVKDGNLVRNTILIDQGLNDEFLQTQLKTSLFEEICREMGQNLKLNMREGYDHSYYFISTFIEEHISFHINSLKKS